MGFLPSGPSWFCYLLLVSSPFLPWQLPKLIPRCSSTLFIPLHVLSYRGLTILVLSSFRMAQVSLWPRTLLSLRPAFSPTWWEVSPAYLYQCVQILLFSPSIQGCLLLAFFLLICSSVLIKSSWKLSCCCFFFFKLPLISELCNLIAYCNSPRLGGGPRSRSQLCSGFLDGFGQVSGTFRIRCLS